MDGNIYSDAAISKFMDKNLFFNDSTLKKYYEQDDLKKFRNRVNRVHSDKSFEKIVYVLVTDSIRDIIYEIISEITVFLRPMGDVIISGGEAFNIYVDRSDKVITSDIDTKFAPRMKPDEKYFGKLQAIKLLLWNKLGEISKRVNIRIRNRILSKKDKIGKFVGLKFDSKNPYVTRRYSLIKKRKQSKNNQPSKRNVFIDVELFALDLKIRWYSPSKKRVEPFNLGGILDIAFMRPNEFGYEVIQTRKRGVTYRNMNTNKTVIDNKIYVAGKTFLIDDIYLMQKLGLRPEKKEKDRQRMVKLARIITKKQIKASEPMEKILKIVHKRPKTPSKRISYVKTPNIYKAKRVNPSKYKEFTTKPSKDKLTKQIIYGLDSSVRDINIPGFKQSSGIQRFNTNSLTWKPNTSHSYIKNEFSFRPDNTLNREIPKNIKMEETLYGFKPQRDKWVPKPILEKSAMIPFIGLKN
tara:strand:- start:3896 stop:5293 length:1398 start_codon:yes stop_codon:yes gene_type:complete